MEFRTAEKADLPAILELIMADRMSSTPEDPANLAAYQAAFDAIIHSPDNHLIVGVLDGRVVATMQLTFIPGLSFNGAWRAQVEGVRVSRDLRSQGVGAKLLQFAIDKARERNCCLMQLTSDVRRVDARRFYERLGFVASHVGMKLKLKAD